MDTIPIIETERLRLRAHRAEDFAASHALWSDPAITRFIGGATSSEQQSWFRLLRYAGQWPISGFGYWAIEDKASGEFAGEAGFADFKRAIRDDMRDVPEIGWVVAPRFQGQGYAKEAVRAIVAWGDERLSGDRTVCMIDPQNAPSIRVARACGYREFDRDEYLGSPVLFFERRTETK